MEWIEESILRFSSNDGEVQKTNTLHSHALRRIMLAAL